MNNTLGNKAISSTSNKLGRQRPPIIPLNIPHPADFHYNGQVLVVNGHPIKSEQVGSNPSRCSSTPIRDVELAMFAARYLDPARSPRDKGPRYSWPLEGPLCKSYFTEYRHDPSFNARIETIYPSSLQRFSSSWATILGIPLIRGLYFLSPPFLDSNFNSIYLRL